MTLTQYIDYFKTIVDKNKLLKHFYLGDMDDVYNNKMNTEPKLPLLFLEVYAKDIMIKPDNTEEQNFGAFVIFDRVKSDNKTEATLQLSLELTEKITKQIISKLLLDNNNCHLPFGEIVKIETNKTLFQFDNLMGWRTEFQFKISDGYVYEEADWE